jgi:hypothetical protein
MVKTDSITESGLKKQIARLKAYHGFEDLRGELLRVLWQQAHSDEHSERIVTEIIDTRRPSESGFISCPLPSELIDYARNVPPEKPPAVRDADPRCAVCRGTGWRIIQRDGLSGAEMCGCRRTG